MDDGVGVRVQRRVTRDTQVAEEAWTCTVDGAPTVEDRSGGRWTRTLRREGGELVWRVVRTVADRPAVAVSERWELSADGRMLQVRSRPEGAGAAVEVRYEFKRVDGGQP